MPEEIQQLESECIDFIHKSGLKLTVPRKVILRAALRKDSSFDAEELLEEARKEDKLISLTTVYRTLPILLKSGIIRKSIIDDEKQRYEKNTDAEKQIHLICSDSKKTISLQDDCLWLRLQFLVKQEGYVAKNIKVRIEVEEAE